MDIEYDRNDDSFEKIVEKNNKYLEEFRVFLKSRNYKDSTINAHINRVDYYINHYLTWGLPKHMQEGCSFDFVNFIECFVNEKVIPASVHNIDRFSASIRLFYECMVEKKVVTTEQFKEFKKDIRMFKDDMVEDFYEKNPKEIDINDVIEIVE